VSAAAAILRQPWLWAYLGAFGVWLAFPVSFALKAALGYGFYRRGRWARLGL